MFWLTLYLWLLMLAQQRATTPVLAGSPPGGRVAISGKVIQAGTNEPIPGAQVTLQPSGMSTVTSSKGEFRLSPTPGRHTLIVERDGLVTQPNPLRGISEVGMSITLNSGQERDDLVFA